MLGVLRSDLGVFLSSLVMVQIWWSPSFMVFGSSLMVQRVLELQYLSLAVVSMAGFIFGAGFSEDWLFVVSQTGCAYFLVLIGQLSFNR